MNALLRLHWLVAGLLWLAALPAAHASHIRGADIAYASVASTTPDVPRYRVTLRLFRDITGVVQPVVQLSATQGGCNSSDPRNLTVQVTKSQSSRLAPVACVGGSTNSASSFGYDVELFTIDVDLPRGQWTLSFTAENRAPGIRNLPNPSSLVFYVSAFLDNTISTQDTSPTFLSTLVPALQGNLAQTYSFSTFDADHDSVAYSMVESQEATAPFSTCGRAIAGAVSPHFQLNTVTGALTAAPGAVQ